MEVRDYQSGDEKAILELFKAAFGKELSEKMWRWRFIDNPEDKTMIKILWNGDKALVHVSLCPMIIDIEGSEVLSGLSMTIMAHPEFPGIGIFARLAESMYAEENKKNELKVVWGYPNNNAHAPYIKNVKWHNLEQIPIFSLQTDKLTGHFLNTYNYKTINSFDDRHVHTYNNVNSEYKIKLQRTVKYLQWRYIDHPTNNYKIFELIDNDKKYYAVCKLFAIDEKSHCEVDIVELCFPDDYEMLAQLLQYILAYYKEQSPTKINMWMPIDDDRHITLERIGFTNGAPVTYSGYRFLDKSYEGKYTTKDWYYCMSDSDVY